MATTLVFLTSVSTIPWSKPANWTDAGHTVDLIGCGGKGGDGATGPNAKPPGAGGAGGGFVRLTYSSGNVAPTTVFQIQNNNTSTSDGANAAAYWQGNNTTTTQAYWAIAGRAGTGVTGGIANATGYANGTSVASAAALYTANGAAGGNGGATTSANFAGGGGGGGAAGVNSTSKGVGGKIGGVGGAVANSAGGGGGGSGGDGTSTAGSAASGATGGAGGNGPNGVAGGAAGNPGATAAANSGAGGGGATWSATAATSHKGGGGATGNTFYSNGSFGSGGGGGGAAGCPTNTATNANGGPGGDFGGGGGGGGAIRASTDSTGGTGGGGLIAIGYTAGFNAFSQTFNNGVTITFPIKQRAVGKSALTHFITAAALKKVIVQPTRNFVYSVKALAAELFISGAANNYFKTLLFDTAVETLQYPLAANVQSYIYPGAVQPRTFVPSVVAYTGAFPAIAFPQHGAGKANNILSYVYPGALQPPPSPNVPTVFSNKQVNTTKNDPITITNQNTKSVGIIRSFFATLIAQAAELFISGGSGTQFPFTAVFNTTANFSSILKQVGKLLPFPEIIFGAPSYFASPIQFNGSSYTKGTSVSGTDNGLASLSFWFYMGGTTGHQGFFVGSTTGTEGYFYNNTLGIFFGMTGKYLGFETDNNISRNTWHHILVSATTSGEVMAAYLDDAPLNMANLLFNNGSPTSFFQTGGVFLVGTDDQTGTSSYFTGYLADFWFAPGVSLLDGNGNIPTATRRQFIDATGHPVNPTSFPAGANILFDGNAANWATNQGSGGSFTITGSLSDGTPKTVMLFPFSIASVIKQVSKFTSFFTSLVSQITKQVAKSKIFTIITTFTTRLRGVAKSLTSLMTATVPTRNEQVGKILTESVTFTVPTVKKAVAKTWTFIVSSVAQITKAVAKSALVARITTTALIATQKVKLLSATAFITTTVPTVQKAISKTWTFVTSIVNQTFKAIAKSTIVSSFTSTSQVTKQAQTSRLASFVSTLKTGTRNVGKILTFPVTFVASSVRAISKSALIARFTSTGQLTKQAQPKKTATVVMSALISLRQALSKALLATVALTNTVTKAVSKTVGTATITLTAFYSFIHVGLLTRSFTVTSTAQLSNKALTFITNFIVTPIASAFTAIAKQPITQSITVVASSITKQVGKLKSFFMTVTVPTVIPQRVSLKVFNSIVTMTSQISKSLFVARSFFVTTVAPAFTGINKTMMQGISVTFASITKQVGKIKTFSIVETAQVLAQKVFLRVATFTAITGFRIAKSAGLVRVSIVSNISTVKKACSHSITYIINNTLFATKSIRKTLTETFSSLFTYNRNVSKTKTVSVSSGFSLFKSLGKTYSVLINFGASINNMIGKPFVATVSNEIDTMFNTFKTFSSSIASKASILAQRFVNVFATGFINSTFRFTAQAIHNAFHFITFSMVVPVSARFSSWLKTGLKIFGHIAESNPINATMFKDTSKAISSVVQSFKNPFSGKFKREE